MPISWDLKSWDFFPDQYPPPPPPNRICQCDPPQKIFSDSDSLSPPPPLPPTDQFRGKNVDLSGTSNKKFFFFFCLQQTTCIMQENEARNRNKSIRIQMILKFWNKWRLSCSFLRATDPNFLLSGSFGHLCGRLTDNPGELAYMSITLVKQVTTYHCFTVYM